MGQLDGLWSETDVYFIGFFSGLVRSISEGLWERGPTVKKSGLKSGRRTLNLKPPSLRLTEIACSISIFTTL